MKKYILGFLLSAMILSACSVPVAPTATATVTVPQEPTVTPLPPTATPVPPRELTICLGQEPSTLYYYGSSSRSMWSVFEALYDGPIDRIGFVDTPVILESLPTVQNGGISSQVIDVKAGDLVQPVNGEPAALEAGMVLLPSGCRERACAVKWDGNEALQMDQWTISFALKPGITWSDGEPLTANDSVYSFHVAGDAATIGSKYWIDRSASYLAVDALHAAWKGIPGALPEYVADVFWHPLPGHVLEGIAPADLLTAEESSRKPIGWGPYRMVEWVPGEMIRMEKNPSYFRIAEGYPKFDLLTFRFLGDTADANLEAVAQGKCDLVDATVALGTELETIVERSNSKDIQLIFAVGPEWEHLDFGINPASYDDGYSPYQDARQNIFGDVRVRQAIAACLDRDALAKQLFFNRSEAANSILPPSHPLAVTDFPIAYDPAAGNALLDQAGWKDLDNDPSTPRQAWGAEGILANTALTLTYVTTDTELHRQAGDFIATSLAGCGVGVTQTYLNPGDLYAPGPEGVLFGRSFDLAQFAWQAGRDIPCALFTTDQIPAKENNWIGTNISGYASAEFDTACLNVRQADVENLETYRQKAEAVQRLFQTDLPVLPLYYLPRVAIARPDLCGLSMDVSARSVLWNLEGLDLCE